MGALITTAASQFALRWHGADETPVEHKLYQGEVTVGRSRDCGIVLPDAEASRQNSLIRVEAGAVQICDLGSRNGTRVNGERVGRDFSPLSPGDRIGIGQTELRLAELTENDTLTVSEEARTVVLDLDVHPTLAVRPAPAAGPVLDQFLDQPVLSEQALIAHGVEVKTVDFAALGGGHGTFAWVDYLRNSGCPASEILVLSNEAEPFGRYQRLCLNSQIPPHERLRSNSDSCPDNIWGFPGYAVREIWNDLAHLAVRDACAKAWQIFGEPAIAQTYTPRSGDVFRAMEREARRIGWYEMLRRGRIRAIRKSDRGRLLAVVSESDERGRRHYVVSGRFLQLAIGYPTIRLLEDLAHYRDRFGDRLRVVNAYEAHDHVYDRLRRQGGTVLLRGRGIVASRVIQRLWEERQANPNITVVHLHRTRLVSGQRDGRSRRRVEHQFEFQPFNWPKSCWTGEQRERLEKSSDVERKDLLRVWRGTTTANRRDWRRIIREGLRDGWYRIEFGVVEEVVPAANGQVATRISSGLAGGGVLDLTADFVIDCTGAEAKPASSPLVADLVDMFGAPLNAYGGLRVTNDFEVEAMRHGDARLFASGATVLGGPHAAVDSFLGLQYAALRAVDTMSRLRPRPKGLRRLNGLYSVLQWSKWTRGTAP